MRESVLTGILACALVFAVGTAQAEAASNEILPTNTENTTVVALLEDVTGTQPADKRLGQIPEEEIEKYTIVKGDSLDKIAKKYETTWKRLFDKNKAIENPDVINPGDEITIPTADEKLEPREVPITEVPAPAPKATKRAAAKSSQSSQTDGTTARGSSAGNLYVAGYCTWYVKNLRPDLPNNLGDAYTWVSRAAAQGMATGSTPRVGAVGQRGNHVVYVQSVNADNTVTITEMNHKGRYVITTRTLPANYFTYIY